MLFNIISKCYPAAAVTITDSSANQQARKQRTTLKIFFSLSHFKAHQDIKTFKELKTQLKLQNHSTKNRQTLEGRPVSFNLCWGYAK